MQHTEVNQAQNKEHRPKGTPIGRQTLAQVDVGLTECDTVIKTCSDTVRAKLGTSSTIPPNLLRELARANAQRGKLVMRRIMMLVESGDPIASDLIDKLLKVKPKGI